jgi:hypothetical protein
MWIMLSTTFSDYPSFRQLKLPKVSKTLGVGGLLLGLGAVTTMAWSGEGRLGLWLLAMSVCFAFQKLRIMTASFLLVHLAASYVIPGAIWGYTESIPKFLMATSFWLIGSITPYLLLHKYFSLRSNYPLVVAAYATVHSFTPLAMFAPAPLIAAGHLFPGTGWIAFCLTALLMAAVIQMLRYPSRLMAIALLCLMSVSGALHLGANDKKSISADIRPIHTKYEHQSTYTMVDIFLRHRQLQDEAKQLAKINSNTLWVFPENIAIASPAETNSWWTFTNHELKQTGTQVVFGTYFHHPKGQIKGAEIMPGGQKVFSRLAVPFFETSQARAPWAESSFIHQGQKLEVLFCYEAMFPLYTAISASRGEGILLLSQLWMDVFDFKKEAPRSPLASRQRLVLDGVARAFGTPYRIAANF